MTRSLPGFLEDKFEPGSPDRGVSRYILSLIPYEETTTWGRGTARAPEAIVEASGHVELFDEVLEVDASAAGVRTLRPDITDLESITRHVRRLRTENPDALLGFIGGEHSITPAIIEGLDAGEFGIVWIDAHADLRASYCGREDNHACAGFHTQKYGPVVQVGIRTLAREEWDFLRGNPHVQTFRHWDADARAAVDRLPRRVYISVDFDGFSPEVIRAVGTPEPGGLYWEEVLDLLDAVFSRHEVIAFDAVELCPHETDRASSFTAARLVYKVLQYHAARRRGR